MTQTITDPERMKRVVEQTIHRLRHDANFKQCVAQIIQAARGADKNLAVTNVALILAQVEQLTREAVHNYLCEKELTEEHCRDALNGPIPKEMGFDPVEDIDARAVSFIAGYGHAMIHVQKLCDDFGAVKILRATQQPPVPPPPSKNGPRGLEA